MNLYLKAVLVLMSVFSFITLAACNELDKEAAKKITDKLNEKYGQEFVVDRIGGGYGTLNTNTLKAIVYPEDASYKKFDVEITKDLEIIWDSYMNLLMAEKLDSDVNRLAAPYFNTPYLVKTFISSNGMSYPDPKLNNKDIPLKEYLDSESGVIIYFLVEGSAELNRDKESEKIHAIATDFLSFGARKAYLLFFYVKPEIFKVVNEKQDILYNNSQANKYFSSKENSYHHTWVRVENTNILQTVDQIKSNFK